MATSREMTEGRIFPQLFYFTLPLLMGNLLQQTYSLVDAAIVGRFLGINSLASVGASTSVVFPVFQSLNVAVDIPVSLETLYAEMPFAFSNLSNISYI